VEADYVSVITADTLVRRRDDLLANDLSPTETVMLDVAGGNYYGLRNVGKAIWDHLQSPMRVNELCDKLFEEFDVDHDTCRRETNAFLEELHEHGLIVAEQ
jgi:hypothetical protein